jgi:hypothetical protein
MVHPMRLTKEQYTALLPFEAEFKYAKTSQCCILPYPKFIQSLEIIYGKNWDTKISKSIPNCGYCKLKMMVEIYDAMENFKNNSGN